MEEVSVRSYDPALPIDKIDIADENVRKNERAAGLESLKASIQHFGLIHPVIVIENNDRYTLIVGQRRLLAFKALDRTTIPALIINSINSQSRMIISFGENMQRRKLPYNDTIEICNRLFKEYSGNRIEKISQIARDLGIPKSTVTQYLGYQLIPEKVRSMVDAGILKPKVASRITSAFWPNEEKIIDIAQRATRLTSAEIDRLYDIGKANPDEKTDKIVEEAMKPPKVVQITITIDSNVAQLLEDQAKKREMDVKELILRAISTYLEEGA